MKRTLKISLLIIVTILIIGFSLKGNIPHEEFNSVEWKNWVETESKLSLRWDMMNSLRNSYELKGKTKSEIILLLGKPTSETESEYSYYLGMAKHGIDIGNLTITFNNQNIVTTYKVTRG